MVASYSVTHRTGAFVAEHLDDMCLLYQEVYSEAPYYSGPLFDLDSFRARSLRQAARAGFALVSAEDARGALVGYAFGFTFEEGRWWSGDATPPAPQVLQAQKFAVIELILRREHRGRGVGHRLVTELLAGRPEAYAVLTAFPDAPARELYRRWGWQQVGTAHHTPDSPILDALALPLSTATR